MVYPIILTNLNYPPAFNISRKYCVKGCRKVILLQFAVCKNNKNFHHFFEFFFTNLSFISLYECCVANIFDVTYLFVKNAVWEQQNVETERITIEIENNNNYIIFELKII